MNFPFDLSDSFPKRGNRSLFYQEFIQNLAKGSLSARVLTRYEGLLRLGDYAYACRQFDLLGPISRALLDIPHRTSQAGGLYYSALALKSAGEFAQSKKALETLADCAPAWFRSRAITTLGALACSKGDFRGGLSLYLESGRAMLKQKQFDPFVAINVNRMIAVSRAQEGDHRGALKHLEQMLPLARTLALTQPVYWFDFLNSLAVELLENGEISRAKRASECVLRSRVSPYFPEWRETYQDVQARMDRVNASFLAINPLSSFAGTNVRRFPPPKLPLAAAGPQKKPRGKVFWVDDFRPPESFKAGSGELAAAGKERLELMAIAYAMTDDEISTLLNAARKILEARRPDNPAN